LPAGSSRRSHTASRFNRLGAFPNWRMGSYEVFRLAGKTDAQIIASAGRTNPLVNTAAAALAGAGVASIGNQGCP
jgi:hypothetical protein